MSTSSISLGGMNAAMNALDSSAWRIARQATTGMASQGSATYAAAPSPSTSSNLATAVDGPSLVAEVISQLQAKNAFLLNLRTFQTGDEMLGSLLDAKA
jgi:hypothetical protein